MSLVSILSSIASIEREISSPVSGSAIYAYENIPHTMAMGQCPCFVNFPGPLTGNSVYGSDEMGREYLEIRNINIRLYLSPFGTGVSEEKTGELVPYFDLVYNAFGKYPRLKNCPEVIEALLVGDTGVTQVVFLGTTYYGIGFTLKVTRLSRRLLSNTD